MSCDPFLSDLSLRGGEGSEEREDGNPTRANQTDASKHGGLLEQVVVGVGRKIDAGTRRFKRGSRELYALTES
jgi:hypothetical protein